MKKIFYLTMAVALMCSCAEDAEDEKTTGSVHGVVNDKQTDDPISGATINIIDAQELEDAIKEFQQSAMDPNAGSYDFSYDDLPVLLSTTTGSDGAYSLEAVKAGKYYVFAKKNAYEENYIPATVEAGRNTKCDVILNRLSLRIIDNEKLGQDIDFLDFGSEDDNVTRTFTIVNDWKEALEWQVTESSEWITGVSTAQGTSQGTIKAGAKLAIIVTIDRSKLTSGEREYTTKIHIISDYGSKELTVSVTDDRTLPTLNTLEATDIARTTAKLNGTITSAGYPAYTERGFVYATSSMPTIATSIAKLTAAVTDSYDYEATATGLTFGVTYYVRAYAINRKGPAYSSNEVSFTPVMTLPQVTTQSATSIGATSATLSGSIVSLGDPAYEERGFVYGTVHNPTVEDDTKKLVSGRGLGDFSANITDLTTGTTYYVRAYATNTVSGASYGAEVSITPQVPQYVELPVANIAVQKTDISSGSINYTTANSECGSSTVNGYTDWRLPTLSELSAIYNNKSMFTGFQQASNNYDYYYWTSTSNGSSSHYQINMTTGGQSSGSNSSTGATYLSYYRARCVRSLP